MKKLFIFMSTMALSPMIYSADQSQTYITIKPLLRKLGHHGGQPAEDIKTVVRFDDTPQSAIEKIGDQFTGYELTHLIYNGTNYRANTTDRTLENIIPDKSDPMHAVYTGDAGYYIKGD